MILEPFEGEKIAINTKHVVGVHLSGGRGLAFGRWVMRTDKNVLVIVMAAGEPIEIEYDTGEQAAKAYDDVVATLRGLGSFAW